jgi:hypothetical protein
MIKNQYILELKTEKPYIKEGHDNKRDVKKVQEWINLWKRYNSKWAISLVIDGDFGPHTTAVVKEFQRFRKLTTDGIVGNKTWRELTEPMRNAFSRIDDPLSLNDLIVAYAMQHLKSSPREFNQNEGTWVRAYMDGHEGKNYPWCMGFVQTIIDQATYTLGETLNDFIPKSYSCDVVGNHGLKNKLLIRNEALRNNISLVKPGDVFLNVKSKLDWTHTGIITGIKGDWFETIEGNTNDEGSREGYEVCRRKRNFKVKNIDIYRIEKR